MSTPYKKTKVCLTLYLQLFTKKQVKKNFNKKIFIFIKNREQCHLLPKRTMLLTAIIVATAHATAV